MQLLPWHKLNSAFILSRKYLYYQNLKIAQKFELPCHSLIGCNLNLKQIFITLHCQNQWHVHKLDVLFYGLEYPNLLKIPQILRHQISFIEERLSKNQYFWSDNELTLLIRLVFTTIFLKQSSHNEQHVPVLHTISSLPSTPVTQCDVVYNNQEAIWNLYDISQLKPNLWNYFIRAFSGRWGMSFNILPQ